jgi:hypothetical protein
MRASANVLAEERPTRIKSRRSDFLTAEKLIVFIFLIITISIAHARLWRVFMGFELIWPRGVEVKALAANTAGSLYPQGHCAANLHQ